MTASKNSATQHAGRFAILAHHAPSGLHWDLMLQWGDVLRTWSLEKQPDQYGPTLKGNPLPDHRMIYLDYEGPISGNRGEVRRWDAGQFTLLDETAGTLLLKLEGEHLAGTYSLISITDNH